MLWYQHPAQLWRNAPPIGNGSLGGMVFGGVANERIQLNEDTIWNGDKGDIRLNPKALSALREVDRDAKDAAPSTYYRVLVGSVWARRTILPGR